MTHIALFVISTLFAVSLQFDIATPFALLLPVFDFIVVVTGGLQVLDEVWAGLEGLALVWCIDSIILVRVFTHAYQQSIQN